METPCADEVVVVVGGGGGDPMCGRVGCGGDPMCERFACGDGGGGVMIMAVVAVAMVETPCVDVLPVVVIMVETPCADMLPVVVGDDGGGDPIRGPMCGHAACGGSGGGGEDSKYGGVARG